MLPEYGKNNSNHHRLRKCYKDCPDEHVRHVNNEFDFECLSGAEHILAYYLELVRVLSYELIKPGLEDDIAFTDVAIHKRELGLVGRVLEDCFDQLRGEVSE